MFFNFLYKIRKKKIINKNINVKIALLFFCNNKPKYSNEFKLEYVQMYLESMAIRGISRVKKVHNSNISYWIKKAGEIAEEEFKKKHENIEKIGTT